MSIKSVLERELHAHVRDNVHRKYAHHLAQEIYRQVARCDRGIDSCLWEAQELAFIYSITPKDISKVQEIL